MSTPAYPVTEEAMVAQLFADFAAGLSSARLEHALARLARIQGNAESTLHACVLETSANPPENT